MSATSTESNEMWMGSSGTGGPWSESGTASSTVVAKSAGPSSSRTSTPSTVATFTCTRLRSSPAARQSTATRPAAISIVGRRRSTSRSSNVSIRRPLKPPTSTSRPSGRNPSASDRVNRPPDVVPTRKAAKPRTTRRRTASPRRSRRTQRVHRRPTARSVIRNQARSRGEGGACCLPSGARTRRRP